MNELLTQRIEQMPLVAILRGITPDEAISVSDVLVDAGFYFIEVTLDSPDWATSIGKINTRHGNEILLGAGTVLSVDDVDAVNVVGGRAIISPNTQVAVIERSKELGMISMPGCYTPTECFTALNAGADILKIFPADTLGTDFIKALSVVLPVDAKICPTGGVTSENIAEYLAVGVFAMGIGSALYQPGKSIEDLSKDAVTLVEACTQT